MKRLVAQGEEFKLARTARINAQRMLMTGEAKEHFDLLGAAQGPTHAKKTYEELLSKVKDYASRRRLDTSAKERMQQGGDPMDVAVVGGWS